MSVYKSDLSKSLHGMMSDLHAAGAISKTTMREFDERCLHQADFDRKKIKELREREHISQAVLAKLVGVSTKTVVKWEAKDGTPPKGAAARLLDLIDRKGLEVLA
ncbi:transcriptional regulator [Terasakiella brassicae]|uniref:Transcriptional regulator n=1 Tax=Terasakiella brassicae TaxID=1634917 RepID=A0A917CAB0_9PROT|nr:helix-turn-helix domain-containing protein [Terasakiella brassicae]GGF75297.1 transcriptional regulator [Terasakiella brassicae]